MVKCPGQVVKEVNVKVREGGRVRKRGRWRAGDRVPYVLPGMTPKKSREVHFGLRGRGAKIGPL
jgi:hypothetical protein